MQLSWTSRLLALTAICTLFVSAQEFETHIFKSPDGRSLPYRLLRPANAQPNKTYPLVLFLHGAGERGTDNQKQLVHGTSLYLEPANREQFPCYVLAPQCPENQQWADMPWSKTNGRQTPEPSQPTLLLLRLLNQLEQDLPINPNRIYLTGLSMGGYGTWDLITRLPNHFAAAAPICGGGDEWTAPLAAQTPIWAFHSSDDSVVPVSRTRNMIATLQAAGGTPHYTEYTSLGHNSWTTAYQEPAFLPWLFSQHLSQPDSFTWPDHPPTRPSVTELPETDTALAGNGPIRRYDWFRDLWKNRRAQWNTHREHDLGSVVFLGDSITQGWGDNLGNSFPGMKVANRGISGDTTRGLIIRLQEDVLSLNPKAIVLLIGTNDLEEKATPETIADNLQLLLAMLHAHNPKLPIVLCQVFPSSASKSRPAQAIQHINALYADIAVGFPQVTLLDTWSIFANEHGDATLEEFPDLLHPNEIGYKKWAAKLTPALKQLHLLP
ncbi:MAG: GDSL-type esterase/lipase family protein [Limisphaerales bacterium]